MPLPTEKTTPTLDVETAKVLLYGPPKIGKTTLAASLDPEHTLFVATEPGLGALSVFAQQVRSWEEFRQIGPELHKGEHQFKTVVIDTVDELHKMCTDAVLKQLGVSYPGDLEFGKGWAAVTDEFRLRVGALSSLGLGVWFISHAKDEEIKQRVGSITKAVPTISGAARKWLTGFCDFIFYAGSEQTADGEQRVLHTAATENFEAGGRVPLPDPLPLDATALREALVAAAPKPAEVAQLPAKGKKTQPEAKAA